MLLGLAHHVGARLEMRTWLEDQLQLDDEANSEIADGSAVVSCRRQRTSVGDLPTSSVSAPQLIPEDKRVLRKHPP